MPAHGTTRPTTAPSTDPHTRVCIPHLSMTEKVKEREERHHETKMEKEADKAQIGNTARKYQRRDT